MMEFHNNKGGILMDLYGNKVSFNGAVARTPIRVVKVVEIEIGPIGCAPCTSGDSPIFDFEQNILFGY